jgi:hypothetical protein
MIRRGFLGSIFGGLIGLSSAEQPIPQKPILKALVSGLKRFPQIRLWSLGDIEKGLQPTEQSVNKLANILTDWNGEDDLDLIWTEDLKCTVIHGDKNSIDVIETPDGKRIIIKGYDNNG